MMPVLNVKVNYWSKLCLAWITIAVVLVYIILGLATTEFTKKFYSNIELLRNPKGAFNRSQIENVREDVIIKPKVPIRRGKHRLFVEPVKHQINHENIAKKGILTKFGLITLDSVGEEGHLDSDVISKLSNYFVMDEFSEKSINRTKKYLTYNDRQVRYNTSNLDSSIEEHPLCPIIPPELIGRVPKQFDDLQPPSYYDTMAMNPKLKLGGRYSPPCQARSKIAIIIPFRGRETQLRLLMAHMHPIWQRQQIDYTVYTISQEHNDELFNKAKLMNIGFLEARKYDKYDCYVFHDVDMTLEHDGCLYRCPDTNNARELSVYLDKFHYKELKYTLPCTPPGYPILNFAMYFGGVAMLTEEQIYEVNGYSNMLWGWGGEDTDMYLRLWKKGFKVVQPYRRKCSYHMMKHKTESSNKKNEGRFALMTQAHKRMFYDGLRSTRYKVLSVERNLLFTNITLDIGRPQKKLKLFMESANGCAETPPWLM